MTAGRGALRVETNGPLPVEWADAGTDRLIRAPEAPAFVRKPAPDAPAAPRTAVAFLTGGSSSPKSMTCSSP